jgi:hypothetical protein
VGVDVPNRLVTQVVSAIATGRVETTRASALHVLRSSLCANLVGPHWQHR